MRVGGSDGAGGMLLHQLGVTVVRRVNAELPRLQPLDTSAGLRVLAIVCRPEEAGFLDPRYTPEAILTALESRAEVSVDFCRPGTMTALDETLEAARLTAGPITWSTSTATARRCRWRAASGRCASSRPTALWTWSAPRSSAT